MSISGPLSTATPRHTDLRISVTDRCNIRCLYCMPAEGVQFRPHEAILSFEEIERFVRVAARLGIRKLRLTGGEPLVRKDVPRLVACWPRCRASRSRHDDQRHSPGRLRRRPEARRAQRLNISLDTLDREKFREITRRDELARVLAGIAAARQAGFEKIKLNAVAIRGMTEEEVVPLARFAREHGLELRFIEFMPLDGDRQWQSDRVLPGEEILAMLAREIGPLEPVAAGGSRAPARSIVLPTARPHWRDPQRQPALLRRRATGCG